MAKSGVDDDAGRRPGQVTGIGNFLRVNIAEKPDSVFIPKRSRQSFEPPATMAGALVV